jgi:hypothetical protein
MIEQPNLDDMIIDGRQPIIIIVIVIISLWL